ncbi:hypothetical protein [Haloplanus pelagicus]|uniref:hypothetical protein n=1 Tax=Haloplanus pelagicus TaxID=2949995 RepID=UPI00203D5F07|nr:hypothetical protein [Haloplanus sp. HW8-1]
MIRSTTLPATLRNADFDVRDAGDPFVPRTETRDAGRDDANFLSDIRSVSTRVTERVTTRAAVRSLELVEVNPILDDHNTAGELAASALDRRIR